jgi:hypothetical protein
MQRNVMHSKEVIERVFVSGWLISSVYSPFLAVVKVKDNCDSGHGNGHNLV